MKKYYSIGLTILFFSIVTSVISPTVAIQGNAATPSPSALPEEDFSTDTPKPTNTPVARGLTKNATASASPQGQSQTNAKTIVYKGEVTATPSAVGKFIVSTSDGQKNVDTDKSTKVWVFDKGQKTVSTVAKIKMGDSVAAIGQMTSDNKALLARFVLVMRNQAQEKPRSAMYGLVSSREASGSAAFVLEIKSPNKDDKNNYVVSSETTVKVKDIEAPKLSDIKIGDRVTFTYYKDEKTNQNIITRIFVIPGRAAGLLKDIRDASAAAEKQNQDEEKLKATAKPTSSPKNGTDR